MKRFVLACILTSGALCSGLTMAKTCHSINQTKLTWTGYKFTEKLGVNGTFDSISFEQNKTSASVTELLRSITFKIEVASLNTGVAFRDKKLVLFVFGPLRESGQITGKVISLDSTKSQAIAEIRLNGITRRVPFKVTSQKSKDGEKMSFTSEIDLLDFAMKTSVEAVERECKALHTGVDGKARSWSVVGLNIEAMVTQEQC